MIRLLSGDARDVLPTLPAESVQCVVTSPPYYGLRSYLDATHPDKHREIGSEPTPDEYLATMVGVFREIRRVLRADGTCWVNMGDSYASSTGSAGASMQSTLATKPTAAKTTALREQGSWSRNVGAAKPKDLLLMPARLALALQAPQHYGPIAKETDRAWLAALIDGEGTISIARNVAAKSRGGEEYCQVGYTPFISIGNQDRELLDKCVAITGYGKVAVKDRPSVDPRGINMRRTYYGWRIDARMAIAVLRDVFPYLVAKRKQAVLAHTLDVSNLAGRSLRGNGPLPADEQAKREQLKVLCNAANQRQPIDMPSWAVEPPSNFEQGWWVRSDIIWHKPNPMPESCTDRPTSAHEHVFLLTRSARYYYDADAVREEAEYGRSLCTASWHAKADSNSTGLRIKDTTTPGNGGSRNLRNVWTIATHAYSAAHFATFPPELAERCIKAGTSERGCCAACGKPWGRVTEQTRASSWEARKAAGHVGGIGGSVKLQREHQTADYDCPEGGFGWAAKYETTGWSPGCDHEAPTVPCTVLDPFIGAGTTALVADRLQRDCIGIDLNTQYTRMAMDRCVADAPLFTSFPPAEPPEDERMADLFAGDEYERPKSLTTPRHDGNRWNENNGRGFKPRGVTTDMAAD